MPASDQEVANMLLRSGKPVVLAVNKADQTGRENPDVRPPWTSSAFRRCR